MSETSETELETLRSLQIVANHLDEAETTLWEVSGEGDQVNSQLDALREDIWSLQHAVEELQSELE